MGSESHRNQLLYYYERALNEADYILETAEDGDALNCYCATLDGHCCAPCIYKGYKTIISDMTKRKAQQ